MKQLLLGLGFVAVFLFPAQPAVASNPVIVGEISGVEVCAQELAQCKAAVFTGTCDCKIGTKDAPGFFWVSVQHDPLPASFATSPIVGGKWNLTTLRGSFSGEVLNGVILNNGNNTFTVTARLRVQKGGNGDIIVSGLLDHDDFPPTFEGDLIQPPQ
jgi:hypothetical protein